jgi:site-specific recombinase XerD
METTFMREYDPGLHTGLNDERIYATTTELHYLDETPVRIEPNGVMVRRIVGGPRDLSAENEFKLWDSADDVERPKVATKNGDDELLEVYLKHANLSPHFEREARAVWGLYQKLVGKPLKSASRNDGRVLVQHFKDSGNKTGTIAKKIGWLRAMCEFAIGEGMLSFNPFAKIVPNSDDELRRKPLSDADMEVCKREFHRLNESDQLLFRFLTTTGARLSEAFQVNGEQVERGIRHCIVGSKTEASQRRMPFPELLLPYLPTKISGRLFAAEPSIELAAKAASKRLNDFLDECGLTDPAKVVHSLRHRMKDKLRAVGCPIDVQYELLGHEKRTVASGYGSPVPLLKEWLDRAGG